MMILISAGIEGDHMNIETVTEEMVERACVVVARRAGECFNTLDEFTKSILRETQRAALTASLTPPSAKGENK